MSSKGGCGSLLPPPPPFQGTDRFYNPPAVRLHHQIYLQQQKMLQRGVATAREPSAAVEYETWNDVGASSTDVALPLPPTGDHGSISSVTNLDSLMESVTPFIEARYSFEVNATRHRSCEVGSLPFYYLEDLWGFFSEWSYYGAGVPLLFNGRDRIQQYYVPSLSGIQLYVDSSNASSQLGGSEVDRRAKSIISSAGSEIPHSCGPPSFQFLEHEKPHNRWPLADKMSMLVSHYPELSKLKSCDLLPSSWISVAWYPIYRIPIGPTLRNLCASFLTFHSLSTQPRSYSPPRFHAPNTRNIRGFADPIPKISLPVFALASYKMRGSIVSPFGPQECEQENSLVQAADKWLNGLEVILPDYQFFRAHISNRG